MAAQENQVALAGWLVRLAANYSPRYRLIMLPSEPPNGSKLGPFSAIGKSGARITCLLAGSPSRARYLGHSRGLEQASRVHEFAAVGFPVGVSPWRRALNAMSRARPKCAG